MQTGLLETVVFVPGGYGKMSFMLCFYAHLMGLHPMELRNKHACCWPGYEGAFENLSILHAVWSDLSEDCLNEVVGRGKISAINFGLGKSLPLSLLGIGRTSV